MEFVEVVTEPILNWAKDEYKELILYAVVVIATRHVIWPAIQNLWDKINGRWYS